MSKAKKTQNQTPKIILKDVQKSFGSNNVLNGVDLSIDAGKSLVVIGGSGTGKSVMLKCILGLMSPDSGSIKIDGEETRTLLKNDRDGLMDRFGMLFQGGALFDSLKVWENISFGLIYRQGMAKDQARDIALQKLIDVGLKKEVGDLFPAEISGGMQKRVSLARAVATNPEIIFFDEPTTGLDPIMGDVINNLIVNSVKTLGATALTITHDMASARKIADHIAMIYDGKIIWHGTVKDLDKTDNPYIQQFIHGRAEGPIQRRTL